MESRLKNLFHQKKGIQINGLEGGVFAKFVGQIQLSHEKNIIIICENQKDCDKLKDEIRFFTPQLKVSTLPSFDVLPYFGLSPNPNILKKTTRILNQLIENKIDILLVPTHALLKKYIHPDLFLDFCLPLKEGDSIARDELIKKLVLLGYERSPIVENPGEFGVRGDIIDVFSPILEKPIRLSFFDDELESLKLFDPISQKTEEQIFSVTIIPLKELLIDLLDPENLFHDQFKSELNLNWESDLKKLADSKNIPKNHRDQIEDYVENQISFHGNEFFLSLFYKKTASLFDYFSPDHLIMFKNDHPIENEIQNFNLKLENIAKESDHIETIFSYEDLFLKSEELNKYIHQFNHIYNESNYSPKKQESINSIKFNYESNLILKSKISSQISKIHNLEPLAQEIHSKRKNQYQCFITSHSLSQITRIEDLLKRFDIPTRSLSLNEQKEIHKNKDGFDKRIVYLLEGELHEGFLDHENKEWWITDEEIFGKKIKRTSQKKKAQSVFDSFSDLQEGDYLIHMDHGIGLFKGLVKLDFDIHKNDFLLIEYLDQDKLYVPIDNLNRVQKYAVEEGTIPLLDKLGSKSWLKTKEKAKKAAKKLAGELLKLQALRESQKGFSFFPFTEEMEEFSASFEFEETRDQLTAIEDVLKDMTSEKPMDRLICGDVGFGKTEVAIRAAYNAVLNHKQVCVLVPTTVLAFQHFTNFKERFKNYPIEIDLLSRFRSNKEQKETVQKLKNGEIDIIIGTHRVLSSDVKFRDLGLLVFDEEHRFGVTHKEKIKKLKKLIDVMTLTATPIPRTLNFALNGIRDLSVINTPPSDRLAVKTFTCSFDEITLREAIQKEIKRGGQIYFVHNRVKSIEKTTKQLQKILPEAKIRFAHGQMHEDELEEIMIEFMEHKFDILVCTTIIESGLDIPNANTMIINRADQLGLAQLYQLRGRVGRSYHQAYCYLVIPQDSLMTKKSKKRIAVLQKFTDLGSGFKIASHDLEIRGAGNILGKEQSGQIAAIGYDMYLHLLRQAIAEMKNTKLPEDFDPEISLNIPAKIPVNLIPDNQLRLILYKEISSQESESEIIETLDNWTNRFGKLPIEIKNLANIIRIKLHAKNLLISEIKQKGNSLLISLHQNHEIEPNIIVDYISQNSNFASISKDQKIVLDLKENSPKSIFEGINNFINFLLRSHHSL